MSAADDIAAQIRCFEFTPETVAMHDQLRAGAREGLTGIGVDPDSLQVWLAIQFATSMVITHGVEGLAALSTISALNIAELTR